MDTIFLARAKSFTPLLPPGADETIERGFGEAAAEWGRHLFFDARLSGDGTVSCATCHDPAHGFADPRPLSHGMGVATRHAPSLLNVAHHRWFGWGGRADTLWSQALGPLENAQEMGGNRAAIARLVSGDPRYQALLSEGSSQAGSSLADVPDALPPAADPGDRRPEWTRAWTQLTPAQQTAINTHFARVGQALAAYQRQLQTGPAPFDRYVAALAAGEPTEGIPFGESERRGFEIFTGKGRCVVCHSGPFFSDGEFHNTGAPPLGGAEPSDPGRYRDSKLLQADPFNAAGAFSASPGGQIAERTRLLKVGSEQWGEFKTPSLRNVAQSPPYMHQGQFETLGSVIDFYDTLENSVGASHHQEQILQPIGLTGVERQDLLAFLRSLDGAPVPSKWTQNPFE